MRLLSLVLPLCVLSTVPTCSHGDPKSFPLRINAVSEWEGLWPMIGGLPFPEGALHDPSRIRVLRDGKHIPAQIDVVATWRDGSIRWALAGLTTEAHGELTVEFGDAVTPVKPEEALPVVKGDDGSLVVDTGPAVYDFDNHGLLPARAKVNGVPFLDSASEGAYLIDNQGRLARVAGDAAEIKTRVLKHGSQRVVIEREGWYVTASGERVARAQIWFYFSRGVPYVRMTHSLILTEDTNDLWVRDFGLDFKTPAGPQQVVFPLGSAPEIERTPSLAGKASIDAITDEEFLQIGDLFASWTARDYALVDVNPDGSEIYLLQENYPHFMEREFLAVIGKNQDGAFGASTTNRSVWEDSWLTSNEVAGDWGHAEYDDFGLTLVVPNLAQQFPKEIAFRPAGARVALWSMRSGREMDFRAVTLVNEYFKTWAEYRESGPANSKAAAAELASIPTNAQGIAKTHDVWLMPHADAGSVQAIQQRAQMAARPPLLQVDPDWLSASEAIGWPMHPHDAEQFAMEEAVLEEVWDRMIASSNTSLRRTGFIAWGENPHLGAYNRFFRVSGLIDYGLRRHAWGLYARSGDRRYYDYGSRFNRFSGDFSIVHWDAPGKSRGEFCVADNSTPFHWGKSSQLGAIGGNTGHDIVHWLLEYYLTGDEYAHELIQLYQDAIKKNWDDEVSGWQRYDAIFMSLRVLANLYAYEWDEEIGRMARELADRIIDLESPNGINDAIRFGALYKVDRSLLSLYMYYRETGDERAREAFLKGVNYKYRFNRPREGAFSGQSYSHFLFSIAYDWTGDERYLRVVQKHVDQHRDWTKGNPGVNVHRQINPTMGLPVALSVLSRVERPDQEWPLLALGDGAALTFEKPAGEPVEILLALWMVDAVEPHAETKVELRLDEQDAAATPFEDYTLTVETMMESQYTGRSKPLCRAVVFRMPTGAPAGRYQLKIPNSRNVVVLDANVEVGEQ